MRARDRLRLVPAGAALVLAGALVVSSSTRAYTTLGFTLGPDARGVRVFDNFTDPEASDNTTADPNWPGVTGAPLAIWKGAAEWSSTLHGDGSGDPTQPGDLGSGGANYDVVWEGLASDPGGATGLTVSEIQGCAGGVLYVSEFGAGGWRLRFYSCWTWDDGPGAPVAGAYDLQGIMAHEYGHFLGLGHSAVPGATMHAAPLYPTDPRSIEADDQAGIQALYGVASPTKPRIRAIAGTSTRYLVGENFAPTGNALNFLGTDLQNVPSSSGGTVISFTAPAGTQPGDVQVVVSPAGGATISNGWPFDPGACSPPSTYCTAKVNSQGCTPRIAFVGTPSASQPLPFSIRASNVINQKTGVLFYGRAPAATPFQGGTLCAAALTRTAMQSSGGNPPPNDCSGTFTFDFNARIQAHVDPYLVPGNPVFAQYYYRDPPSSFGAGLTDAVAFTICP